MMCALPRQSAHLLDAHLIFSNQPKSTAYAAPITRSVLNVVIKRVTANWQGDAKAAVTTVARFDDLPAPILAAAQEQGYDNSNTSERIPRVTYKGSIYLVQENPTSELEVEETLWHGRLQFALRGKLPRSVASGLSPRPQCCASRLLRRGNRCGFCLARGGLIATLDIVPSRYRWRYRSRLTTLL